MSQALEYYRYREYLTIHEISCLAFETDPYGSILPDGYSSIRSLISEAVYSDIEVINQHSGDGFIDEGVGIDVHPRVFYKDDIPESQCNQLAIFFGAHVTRKHSFSGSGIRISTKVDEHTKIRPTELIRWLESKKLKLQFFFPDYVSEQPHQAVVESSHRTKLMDIMDKAIARYYGNNFDIKDKDSYPKQEQIIEWLRSEYSLSERQALSIEIVISPR